MGHVQTQEEWEAEMSEKILSYVRDELYLELRFMDIALSALTPKADVSIQTFATDGTMHFYATALHFFTFMDCGRQGQETLESRL